MNYRRMTSTPKEDGYYMPGEFEAHHGCIMIWPVRPGSWPHEARAAQQVFARLASQIAESEEVYMLTDPAWEQTARSMLPEKIRVVPMESDDAWARDVGPTFVVNGKGDIRGVDWQFNAWGGTYDGLYQNWAKDEQVADLFCREMDCPVYDARRFVLEGGSIHSDGEGTVIVTESCLLSPGRNPQMTRGQIEEELKHYLGAEKIIWLPCGIYNDETNEHVDNVCAFVAPGEVVLAWTDDTKDPQYEMSVRDYEVLSRENDAKGRPFVIHKLPIPDCPVCVTEQDLEGYEFEEGEDLREAGERLAASYVNFYIANEAVFLPQFGDRQDETAVQVLTECFPGRKICPVPARDILVGGGNIHCITQQIPQFSQK